LTLHSATAASPAPPAPSPGATAAAENAAESARLKERGNAAYADGDYDSALLRFSEALRLTPRSHVLHSNRAAAYACLERYAESLTDASAAIEIKPDWAKGYTRKGTALFHMGKIREVRVHGVVTIQLMIESGSIYSLINFANPQKKKKKKKKKKHTFL
jgi:tetratricopeptide (TPR) repeat protein